jgi:hypothetical protein
MLYEASTLFVQLKIVIFYFLSYRKLNGALFPQTTLMILLVTTFMLQAMIW